MNGRSDAHSAMGRMTRSASLNIKRRLPLAKAMILIDGTWLHTNTPRLSALLNRKDSHIHFGKLPKVLGDKIAERIGSDIDVVRTYLFGSYANNFDRRDADAVQRRLDFFNMLREEHHYEVETFPINFFGRR